MPNTFSETARRQWTALVVVVATLLAGCGGASTGSSGPSAGRSGEISSSTGRSGGESPGGALDRVRFRMSWLPSSEYAGIIVAAHNGIYKKHGIDCTIEPGGVGLNSLQLVASGADEFGLAGSDSLLVARSRKIPVRAFATEFQQSPQVFFARKSSGITTPYQWPGHIVGIKVGKTAETLFKAVVGKLHLNASAITTAPVKAGLQEFYAGKVDVWPGFVFDEPVEAEQHGIPVNIMDPARYGIRLYSDVIFTTDSTIQTKPDEVRRFLQATQEGWLWTAAHPDEALKIVLDNIHGLDAQHEKIRLQGTLARVVGNPRHPVNPVGKMDPAVWKSTYDMLDQQHLLVSPFPVTDAYTLQFLDK